MTPQKALTTMVIQLALALLFISQGVNGFAGDFNDEFDLVWGDQRAKIAEGGNLLTLSLDQISGSGFVSKKQYLFGRIDMQIKLVPGNSAGTVTAYYMSSEGGNHDEIDFEFLGNTTGEPYTLHTNVYSEGKGDREQQFHLWFDPTKDFHSYSILWNPKTIIFLVDNIPIREFKNMERLGVAFPSKQAMRIHSSLWNADQWATRGGLVKTDWSNAPFTASYRGFGYTAADRTAATWQAQGLDPLRRRWLRWARKHHMVYDYCADNNRFPQGRPSECNLSRV